MQQATRIDNDGYHQPLHPPDVWARHRVYFIRAGVDGPVKVGFSTDVQRRLAELQTASPLDLKLECQIVGTIELEHEIHRRLKAYNKRNVRGEWYELSSDDISWLLSDLFCDGLVPS